MFVIVKTLQKKWKTSIIVLYWKRIGNIGIMYNIAICDDEQDFVAELEEMIRKYAGETGIEIRTVTFKNGLELTECNKIGRAHV